MTQIHTAFDASTTASTTVDSEEIYQLVKRGDVNPHEVEVVGAHAVEVTVLWKSAILHVAHLDGSKSFVLATREGKRAPAGRALLSGLAGGSTLIAASAATGSYALGAVGTLVALAGAGAGIAMDQRNVQAERDASRFVVAEEMLGGASSADVVINDAAGTRFVFAAGAEGHVECEGVRRALADLIASGEAKPSGRGTGVYEIAVRAGGRYRVEIGGLTVTARQVAPGRAVSRNARRDPALAWAGAGALACVAALVGASLIATSGGNGYLAQNSDEDQLASLRDFVAQVHERQTPPESGENQGMAAPSNSGMRSRGEEGQAGDHTATQTHHRGAVRDNGQPPHLANQRGDASQLVADRGIFGAGIPLNTAGGSMIAPWSGATTESGRDATSVNGGLDGEIGASLGMDGLGGIGTGAGGGGIGEGMVGVGVLGTVGRRGVGGPGIGEGIGHHLTERGSGPIAVPGPVQTQGDGISREAVRRVVLRNLGQVAHCHEQGLSQNPSLAGRVVVRFAIGASGAVTVSTVAQNTVPVASVASCIAGAVRRWTFPAPVNGAAVVVTYPFTLEPPVQ